MTNGQEVKIDPINITFAKTMEKVTWVGIIVMLVFGVLYLAGISSFVDPQTAISHWGQPTGTFWQDVKGIEVHGYGWFFTNLSFMDCVSMLGICILAIAPLVAVISSIPKAAKEKTFVIFFIILSLEFLFAVVRPLIMAGGGE